MMSEKLYHSSNKDILVLIQKTAVSMKEQDLREIELSVTDTGGSYTNFKLELRIKR
ncbi:hypothetical protein KNU84_gp044 [Bacteriophage DSS3_VP1]|uniref:Uncharacterized protein n=1 Tax=Bacteriophage DSS3_VP1 TaxID=2664196 RepID=A0A7S5KQ97_9CAUD|nr:hypothetical protein KNU84_gp044 [Bacteriophage DSS3_VP1]QGH74660.1 hypothetical protein DSS3VP1_00092 [Bacteriophage DSS3_VP1]